LQEAPVYRTSARLLCPAKSLRSASLAAVKSDVKASLAASVLVATRPPTDASVFLILSVNRIFSAFLLSSRPSANHLAVPALTANTDNPIVASVIHLHREIHTNLAECRNAITAVTPPNAASTPNADRESTESTAPVQLVSKEILTSLAKTSTSVWATLAVPTPSVLTRQAATTVAVSRASQATHS